MTIENNRFIEAVARMTQMTQEGKLSWAAQKVTDTVKEDPDDKVNIIFTTNYKDKKLRIYKRSFKDSRPSYGIAAILRNEEVFWNRETVLEFVDDQGRSLWAFPEMNVVDDLLSAVQYQAAGVKEFIDDILSEKDTEKLTPPGAA